MLNCTSCGGWPQPKIHWFHQNVKMNRENISVVKSDGGNCTKGMIFFPDLEDVYDRDAFACVADNGFRQNKTAEVVVRVGIGTMANAQNINGKHNSS